MISLITIVPVLLVTFAGTIDSYALLLVFGFFLGIGGTTFAVGIPFVNAWYEKSRRGFATGVFGVGMGGTALSAFFTPRFVTWFGYVPAHLIIAAALALTAGLVMTRMKDSPAWQPNTDPVVPKLKAAAQAAHHLADGVPVRGDVRWVRRVLHLPARRISRRCMTSRSLDAGARTAGFAIAAVIARPIGGILSDRLHPKFVVMLSLAGAAVMAVVVSLQPPPELAGGRQFHRAGVLPRHRHRRRVRLGRPLARRPNRVGSVTGIVGAAGGSRRVLPTTGDGRDLRCGGQQLHHRAAT